MIYTDLLRGKAAAYDKEMYDRYALLAASKERDIYLPAIHSRPQSIFYDDINANKTHWWNRCMAGYYGKDVIYLKKENE